MQPTAPQAGGQERRVAELDLLKALALAGVVVIHATAWVVPADASPVSGPYALLIGLARFCVPAFVMASGFAVYRSQGGRPKEARSFLKRRWTRTLIPWLVWMPLYLALDLWQGMLRPDRVGDWLLSGGGHLYFLLLVAQLYLVLLIVPRGRRGLWLFTAAALAVQLVLDAGHAHGPLAADRWAGVQSPFWLGYFALGCLAASELDRLRRPAGLWPLAAVATVVATGLVLAEAQAIGPDHARQGEYSFLWPSRLAATAALCLTVLWAGSVLRPRAARLFAAARALGGRSLGVYILQSAVLVFLGPRTSDLPSALRVVLLVPATLVIAYLGTLLLERTRVGRFALGEAASRPAKLPQGAEDRRFRARARVA